MGERLSIKTERDEQSLFNARVIVAAILILFALLGVVARAYHLQVVENEKYAELSREHYQKRIPIPPNRGQIYDNDGMSPLPSAPVSPDCADASVASAGVAPTSFAS